MAKIIQKLLEQDAVYQRRVKDYGKNHLTNLHWERLIKAMDPIDEGLWEYFEDNRDTVAVREMGWVVKGAGFPELDRLFKEEAEWIAALGQRAEKSPEDTRKRMEDVNKFMKTRASGDLEVTLGSREGATGL